MGFYGCEAGSQEIVLVVKALRVLVQYDLL